MNTKEVFTRLKAASNDLSRIEQEMARPNQDVVTHSLCYMVRSSISNLLTAYLLSLDKSPSEEESLESLIQKCRQTDSAFDEIDFSPLACKCMTVEQKDEAYCLSLPPTQIESCTHIARQAKEIMINKWIQNQQVAHPMINHLLQNPF